MSTGPRPLLAQLIWGLGPHPREAEGLEIKAKKVKKLFEPKLRMGKSEKLMP